MQKLILAMVFFFIMPKCVHSMGTRIVQIVNGTQARDMITQTTPRGAIMKFGFSSNKLRLGFEKGNCILNYMVATEQHSKFFEIADKMEKIINTDPAAGRVDAAAFKRFCGKKFRKRRYCSPKNPTTLF